MEETERRYREYKEGTVKARHVAQVFEETGESYIYRVLEVIGFYG